MDKYEYDIEKRRSMVRPSIMRGGVLALMILALLQKAGPAIGLTGEIDERIIISLCSIVGCGAVFYFGERSAKKLIELWRKK